LKLMEAMVLFGIKMVVVGAVGVIAGWAIGGPGIGVGKVIPREAGAEWSASGPVMIGKLMPGVLGAAENKAGHEAARRASLLGRVRGFFLGARRKVAIGGMGEGVCGGVEAGVGVMVGLQGTQSRVMEVGEGLALCGSCVWWMYRCSTRGRGTRGAGGVGGGVARVAWGVAGCGINLSMSLRILARWLMVSRIFLTLTGVGREDTSFKVDPRDSMVLWAFM
jgi:hypothetical protein